MRSPYAEPAKLSVLPAGNGRLPATVVSMGLGRSTDLGSRRIEVVTEGRRFEALQADWESLWSRSSGAGASESFDYCLNAWRAVARPQGHRLFCLVGWQDDTMVAVWPLTLSRKAAWTVGRSLGASGTELHQVMMDDGIDQRSWTRSAWDVLRKRSGADLVRLPMMLPGPAREELLGVRSYETTSEPDAAVHVDFGGATDWDSYYESLSASGRSKRAKARRRLAALGAVSFEVVRGGDPRAADLVQWILENKRAWSRRTGKDGSWLHSSAYQDFLVRQSATSTANQETLVMRLVLEGRTLASTICILGGGVLEGVIAAFDPEYDKFSPGVQLNDYSVKWAFDHGLEYSLGPGTEPYKLFWNKDGVIDLLDLEMTTSRWGAAATAGRRAVERGRPLLARAASRISAPAAGTAAATTQA